MSNALEAASLIMVPSGYEDGTLASVKPNDGTGDFTFSRGSNLSATRVGPNGYIERGYENLLLQSNSFLTTWTQVSILLPTSGQAGYDGSTDAWYFEKTGAFGRLQQPISTSGVRTLSVYLKAKDSSWVSVEASGTNTSRQYFDLTNISKGSSNNIISSSIEDAGDGWRKCSITYEGTKTFVFIFIAEGNGQIAGTSGSLYIQDAMLNQGLVAYPYIETTTAPVAGGILEDMPRLDWASGSPSLLLEPSRTNLLTHSEYYNGWTQSGTTLTTNTTETLSPEGLYNASKLVGNGTTGVINSGIAKTGSVVVSVYLKSVSGSVNVIFKDPYGVLANEVKSVTTEWQRFDFIGDNGASFAGFWIDDIPASGIYMWGAQLEQGLYPTSYIPTYGVSQTRLAESCVVNGATSSIGQTEGTMFLDFVYENNGGGLYGSFVANATGFSDFVGWRVLDYNNAALQVLVRISGTYQVLDTALSVFSVGNRYKVAMKYSSGDIKVFVNNQEKYSSTATYTTPSVPLSKNTISGSTINAVDSLQQDTISKVNQSILFPTALSDEECIQLTTV